MNNSEFPSAKVIAHSKAPNGEELITMEIELHRFILPEFNTHRCFSRNLQSSRAIPVEKMIEQVRTSPALPVHWGKNQRGMVAEEEFANKDAEHISNRWVLVASKVADEAEYLSELGVHKQVVNRLLEPFMKTKGVVTATKEGFESFFKLRSHKDAQPEIKSLSDKMKEALSKSVPNKLGYGDYHLPYISGVPYNKQGIERIEKTLDEILRNNLHLNEAELNTLIKVSLEDSITNVSTKDNLKMRNLSLEDAVKISSSCCAQVSYRSLDDSLEKALKIYDMLNLPENGIYPEDPPHFSPTEHVAKIVDDYEHESFMGGNFSTSTFWQYRKALEIGNESVFTK